MAIKVGVKLGAIICHKETSGGGDDEVAGLFVIEAVDNPNLVGEAFVVDADVTSDDGPEEVSLENIEASDATRSNPGLMFNSEVEGNVRLRIAGLEIDGVGSTEALARTQMEDFRSGPLGDTRHDTIWAAEFVVDPAVIEQYVLDGPEPPDYGFTSSPISMTNRWDRVNTFTAHQHLVFTSNDEESEYEIVLAYLFADYRPPEEEEPPPFVPLPIPLPWRFIWPQPQG